jgi:hypothetical protein
MAVPGAKTVVKTTNLRNDDIAIRPWISVAVMCERGGPPILVHVAIFLLKRGCHMRSLLTARPLFIAFLVWCVRSAGRALSAWASVATTSSVPQDCATPQGAVPPLMPHLRGVRSSAKCATCGKRYQPRRSDAQACSKACRQRAYRKRLAVTQARGVPHPAIHRPNGASPIQQDFVGGGGADSGNFANNNCGVIWDNPTNIAASWAGVDRAWRRKSSASLLCSRRER